VHGPRDTHLGYEWGPIYKAKPALARTPENAGKVVREIKAAGAASPELRLPMAVVKRARNRRNLLHPFFEWDNGVAAERWREEQARDLMRSVRVVTVTVLSDGSRAMATPVPVFAAVTLPDQGRAYREVTVLTTTDAGRGALLREAVQQLERFRARYRAVVELTDVMRAIDHLTDPPEPEG
jgi:hypothetical protein